MEAMDPASPMVHEGSPTYETFTGPVQPQRNLISHDSWSGGDVEHGFRESDLIFEHTFTTPWVHQADLEPYTRVVDADDAGGIQVWANNKQPFRLRSQLAGRLDVSEEPIRVNPRGIGGDFGGKAGAMDVPMAYTLSLRAGRPVKMIMTYIEELMAANPRHPSAVTIKTGVKRDDRLCARESRTSLAP